jgi:hypothetical protein
MCIYAKDCVALESECYSLASLTVPSYVDKIGAKAFKWCHSLKDVLLSACELSKELFIYSGVENVHLCEGVQFIGTAFQSCISLTEVNIPSTVTAVVRDAFQGCTSLEKIQLHKGLLSIDESAFFFTSLKRIQIPSTVTKIDTHAFANCSSLTTVRLVEGLESKGVFSINSLITILSSLMALTV